MQYNSIGKQSVTIDQLGTRPATRSSDGSMNHTTLRDRARPSLSRSSAAHLSLTMQTASAMTQANAHSLSVAFQDAYKFTGKQRDSESGIDMLLKALRGSRSCELIPKYKRFPHETSLTIGLKLC